MKMGRSMRSGVHAFPAVTNGPSNKICEKNGFTNLGEWEVEFATGSPLQPPADRSVLNPGGGFVSGVGDGLMPGPAPCVAATWTPSQVTVTASKG